MQGYLRDGSVDYPRTLTLKLTMLGSAVFVDGPHVIGEPSAGSGAFEVYDSDANAGGRLSCPRWIDSR